MSRPQPLQLAHQLVAASLMRIVFSTLLNREGTVSEHSEAEASKHGEAEVSKHRKAEVSNHREAEASKRREAKASKPPEVEPPGHREAEVAFGRLVAIMGRLRAPDGCPWDREQDFRSLRRYVLEEAYEVVQAIDDGDMEALPGELGDLLLQVVFLSQMASEQELFDAGTVADAISDKLVRRHPHVFGDGDAADAEEVLHRWESIKRAERGGGSVLDDIPASFPALARAEKLGRRAAHVGFDWPDVEGVLRKVGEELHEVQEAVAEDDFENGRASTDVEQEVGDLLFAVANLARRLGFSPEAALRRANEKFERRFRAIEPAIDPSAARDLEALDALWEAVKRTEG